MLSPPVLSSPSVALPGKKTSIVAACGVTSVIIITPLCGLWPVCQVHTKPYPSYCYHAPPISPPTRNHPLVIKKQDSKKSSPPAFLISLHHLYSVPFQNMSCFGVFLFLFFGLACVVFSYGNRYAGTLANHVFLTHESAIIFVFVCLFSVSQSVFA